jgi:hypothetical protein
LSAVISEIDIWRAATLMLNGMALKRSIKAALALTS